MASSATLTGRYRWPSVPALADQLTLPGTWAVFLYRLASACNAIGLKPLSRLVYFLNVVLFGAELQPTARVGPGLVISHPVGTGFGDVRIGRNARIMGGVRFGQGGFERGDDDGWPTVGDDCFFFDGAKVFGPVTIGDRAVVSTSAVVVRDVPPDVIVAGNPARVVRQREPAADRSEQPSRLEGE